MPTTHDDIRSWLKEAKKLKSTHLVVACDTFDHDDYPMFFRLVPFGQDVTAPGEYELVKRVHNLRDWVRNNLTGQNMQICMEVYRIADDWEGQLKLNRCFRYE